MTWTWTPELEDEIVSKLVERSLRKICKEDEDVPSRMTILRHQRESSSFDAKCARASEQHAEYLIEKAEDTAEECKEDSAQSAKVKISFAQWYAAKLKPKKYGDKLEHTGDVGITLVNDSIPRPKRNE